MDIWEFFYHALSKKGIGLILISLSIIEALSLKIYGISFFETAYALVKNNQILVFTIVGLYVCFLLIFVVVYYLLSKKYDFRFIISKNRKEYKFLIFPVILSGLFVALFSFIFVIILINLIENFIFQKILGIYGKSLIALILGIVWLIIIRFFWKSILSEK